ncbi:D-amino-acid oxidase [Actinoplanes sp. L3-i22]|nr:D-amino-acid oxidase [Actinoplanes sp. L3-i22]
MVVGAGAIGLTVAHELAVAGHRVRIVADRAARDSVSAVAAAIWFPHDVAVDDGVLESARVTYRRLESLAEDPASGVVMRSGLVRIRHADPDLAWTTAIPRSERVPDGVRCVLPVVETGRYLEWLGARVAALGVATTRAELDDLADQSDDLIVVAAGLRSGALLGGDDEVYPIRGQVVRLANPGLTEWILDNDHPDGLTYVVPRAGDVVCGGTGQAGDWNEQVDPATEAAILERARGLVPALAGQPVLSRAVGLRPARSQRRLERIGRVVACYGHGGSGFTLSWGDAARVVELCAR